MKRPLFAGCLCLLAAQALAWWVVAPRRPASPLPAGYFAALPPGEAVGALVLGGFRGLAIDLLWLRATSAKEAGRTYESVALFDLISRLQPRHERVWEFLSWDLAYNIGHEAEGEDAKWAWFLSGVEVQARGAQLNPQSWRIVQYLGWLFHHKGEQFLERIASARWSPVLNGVLAPYGHDLTVGLDEPGLRAYQIAERLYIAAVRTEDQAGLPQPAWVRRMVPILIEKDANALLRQGDHYRAARRLVDALRAWQEVRAWAASDRVRRKGDAVLSEESFQRNGGRVIRRLQSLLPGLATAASGPWQAALDSADYQELGQLLAVEAAWRLQLEGARRRWLDEG